MTRAASLHLERLDAPADALWVASALGDEPGLAVLAATESRGPEGRFSYVSAWPSEVSDRLDPEPGGVAMRARGRFAGAPRWIGVLPYESFRHLERDGWKPAREDRPPPPCSTPRWLRYRAVVVIDHEGQEVWIVGEDAASAARLARAIEAATRGGDPPRPPLPLLEVLDEEAPEAHEARVRRALSWIRSGDLYQVNLSRRLRLQPRAGYWSRSDAVAILARLAGRAPSPFSCALDLGGGVRVVGSSPELCLRIEPDPKGSPAVAWTEPIKGTRPRIGDAADDARAAAELDEDPKERAELTMIIDVERHDLGRIAEPGGVELVSPPRVAACGPVWHRLARLRAEVRRGVTRAEVLAAMVPSGSVTGAPKIRAMEAIAELEPHRRGLYTGAYGALGHDGCATLAMAIRTVVLTEQGGEYLAGGGIVLDSDPARELLETRWKSVQLTELLSGVA